MADILLASVWNRVMISDLNEPALWVGFLLALRYLLSPLSIWAGFRSDNRILFGLRRTPYIWLGRLLMVVALPLLALGMGRLAEARFDVLGWLLTSFCFLLFGIGTLLSGSTFLALVRDTAPVKQQGFAVSIVLTTLIIFFPVAAVIYSRWMPAYDLAAFQQMVYGTALIAGFFWFISIVGVEKRHGMPLESGWEDTTPTLVQNIQGSFLRLFAQIWEDRRTRRFLVFFAVATLAAWMQDAILEPFGADLFGLAAEATTDFGRVWLGMTAITLISSNILLRKRSQAEQSRIASFGLFAMVVGMALLAVSAFTHQLPLVEIALAIFGAGFGVYSFGGFNLMAIMTRMGESGAYLGMWTVIELLGKGLGTFLGGGLRDAILSLTGSAGQTYGLIFSVETAGLLLAILILLRVNIRGWLRDSGRVADSAVEQTPLLSDA